MRVAAPSWRALAGWFAKGGVSALLAWFVIARFDLSGLRDSLAAASDSALALAFAAFLLIPLLGGLRWWTVLRGLGERCRLGEVMALFSVATVAGQVLPSIAGDGVRVWLAARHGLAVRAALHSVLLERVGMVLALLALALATAPLLTERFGNEGQVWLCAALLAAGLAGLGVLMAADLLPFPARHWRLARGIADTAASTRALVLSRWGFFAAAVSLLSNLHFTLTAVLLGHALGLPASATDFLAVMPVVTLATTLPISLGGWGVREGILVFLLGRLGVPAGEALAFSLAFGAGGVLCGLPGLAAWWLAGCVRATASHKTRRSERRGSCAPL
jgi:uncharacterized membrane protein YbhN (UPF0104 family)